MFADDVGIHLDRTLGRDIIVYWGEIESVWAIRWKPANGGSFLEVSLNHFYGVDFRFQDSEPGYAEVMAAMEKHLIGFSRARAESAPIFEKEQDIVEAWKRDTTIQPFQLQPTPLINREPTEAERIQIAAAHKASVATCENLLRRPLSPIEATCVYTGFENGRIVGNISSPLSEMLKQRQTELNTERSGDA